MYMMLDIYTPRDIIKMIEEESGTTIKYHETSYEEYDKMKDVPQMWGLWAKYVKQTSRIIATNVPDITLLPLFHAASTCLPAWVSSRFRRPCAFTDQFFLSQTEFIYKHGGNPGYDLTLAKKTHPEYTSVRAWVKNNLKSLLSL